MGKGDKKTKKGKIVKGTYGAIRPKKKSKRQAPPKEVKTKK